MTPMLPFDRPYRLAAMSCVMRSRAVELAEAGQHLHAMRALALSEALHHAAGGDRIGARLSLIDARTYRRALNKQPTAEMEV